MHTFPVLISIIMIFPDVSHITQIFVYINGVLNKIISKSTLCHMIDPVNKSIFRIIPSWHPIMIEL